MVQKDVKLINSVVLMAGSSHAGKALSLCNSDLFTAGFDGRKKVLVTIMAGTSSDDISTPVQSLTAAGVQIIAVGVGFSIDQSQLANMAFESSYFLTTNSFLGLSDITGSTSALISQGTSNL